MKKIKFALLFLALSCRQQERIVNNPTVDKWINATINIQCIQSGGKKTVDVYDQYSKHLISRDQLLKKTDSINRHRLRVSGTAVYLICKNHHYLITSRHLLNDASIGTNAIFNNIVLVSDTNYISKTRVMDGNQNMTTSEIEPHLFMWLCYKFSSIDQDIAIVCLEGDSEGPYFWKTLNKRGYKPIETSDIDDKCNIRRGDNIMAVGFTEIISDKGKKSLPSSAFNWEAYNYSRPVVTFGSIADPEKDKNYFLGNIFVYHGNSGGPIVVNDKLVGITCGAVIEGDSTNSSKKKYYMMNYSKFMKSSIIEPLLESFDSYLFHGR
ncbi:trypsin-like peptidase [Mucilaginibacter frigoritolerans]|uniref:Trypsin-like peptidase n=1 Tax=Mucilaginibacter frigoritolerans TaxID=652788 RepID=A0A562UDH1_9SPHI|nr:trypsin-like peptidase domain-containing protein [Mucilaginibacter frigoritolerans]TWJ03527.1 trypsin-like peptidase [Mucilaginibacter frigoritolerans]